MGEYEDRYPEAYGRPADEPIPPAPARQAAAARPEAPATAPQRQAQSPVSIRPIAAQGVPGGGYEDRYPEAYRRDEAPPAAQSGPTPQSGPTASETRLSERAASVPPAQVRRDPVVAASPRSVAPTGNDYEDRYPEAYRRDEAPPAIQQARDVAAPSPAAAAQERRDTRELQASTRSLFGLWRHRRDDQQRPSGAAMPSRAGGTYRGLGPRGYTRPDARIREELCDRLTEDAYLDASEIEVAVSGGAVTLSGTVADAAAQRRAQQHAAAVGGVTAIRDSLRVR